MKKIITTSAFAFALIVSSKVHAQQGFGTNQPDKSAAVEIKSANKGLLIPRVALTGTDTKGPIKENPANSLLVYNTATAGTGTTAVVPGFYYWDTNRWVRLVSSVTERQTTVAAGENISVVTNTDDPNNTIYTVGVKAGDQANQFLVTKETSPGVFESIWVDASTIFDLIITATNGLTKAGNEIKLGGELKEATTIKTDAANTLALTGLEKETPLSDDTQVVISGAAGVLKYATLGELISAGVTLSGDVTGSANDTKVEKIQNVAVNSTVPTTNQVLTFDGTEWKPTAITPGTLADKKDITTDGIVTVNGTTTLESAVLETTTLAIADKKVTAGKLDAGIGTDSRVATADAEGNVSYQLITPGSLTDKKTLSGDGITVTAGTVAGTATSVAEAVLADVTLGIADGAVTAPKLRATEADGTTHAAEGTVAVANADGTVTYKKIDATNVVGKNLTTGSDVITLTGTPEGALLNDVTIGIRTATGQDLGVVKEATTNPTVTIATDGSLAVNVDNIAATQGKNLTSESITVSNGDKAVLKDVKLEITPGINAGEVLTTVDNGGTLTTGWTTITNKVEVENGLKKNTAGDKIHLGGDLIKPTTITANTTNTLGIAGLETAAAVNKIVVAEDAAGVLRTVERIVNYTASGSSFDVAGQSGYSVYTQEITVMATIGAADLNITLPNAATANGQVINVKIANTTEPDAYVNIANVDGATIYGSLPYQGWIIKSDGTAWKVVGRN